MYLSLEPAAAAAAAASAVAAAETAANGDVNTVIGPDLPNACIFVQTGGRVVSAGPEVRQAISDDVRYAVTICKSTKKCPENCRAR